MHREHLVADRTLDQGAERRAGEARAGVLRDRAHHVAVAALDQHVGDGLAQRAALRDREQMLLAVR